MGLLNKYTWYITGLTVLSSLKNVIYTACHIYQSQFNEGFDLPSVTDCICIFTMKQIMLA